jgi:tRNA nucleotidyltransferase/poly(A) polymerase
MRYELYEIGGHVRDGLLGIPSKDIDYTVVIPNDGGVVCEYGPGTINGCYPVEVYDDPLKAFSDFVDDIKSRGYEVFLETPDCLTVRAKRPDSKEVADFVIARKETYVPESRTPTTELGTLYDDIMRRDFTLNAIAKDMDGNIIDLVGGVADLKRGILRTPIDTVLSFNDDPLRVIRALRFSVTKGFGFSDSVMSTLSQYPLERLKLVSEERIREELFKCLSYDSAKTMRLLVNLEDIGCMLLSWILNNTSIWLNPTLKK